MSSAEAKRKERGAGFDFKYLLPRSTGFNNSNTGINQVLQYSSCDLTYRYRSVHFKI